MPPPETEKLDNENNKIEKNDKREWNMGHYEMSKEGESSAKPGMAWEFCC